MKRALLLCMAVILAAGPIAVEAKGLKRVFLPAPAREAAAGRDVTIELGQREIGSTFDTGRIAEDYIGDGGMLGWIYWTSTYDKTKVVVGQAAEKAEAGIRPLRAALQGFDVEPLATAATRDALGAAGWFHSATMLVEKNPTIDSRILFAKIATTPQIAFVTYQYELSHDGTNIKVIAVVRVVDRAALIKDPKHGPPPLLQQQIISVVELRNRSYDLRDNVAAWSANNGALAREALTRAFASMKVLIPRSISMTLADAEALNAKGLPRAQGAGYNGPILSRDSSGLLIWVNGLMLIQQAG